MNPNLKDLITADVFCLHDMSLYSNFSVNGNLYCHGEISEAYIDDESIKSTLEVFGDLYVDGIIYVTTIVVHGNLHCAGISCPNITIGGDIFIKVPSTNKSNESSFINCLDFGNCYCDGNIHGTSEVSGNVLVCNGYVNANHIDVDSILACDLDVTKDIQFTDRIYAIDTISCSELWSPCFLDEVTPTITAKKIISKNFKIG